MLRREWLEQLKLVDLRELERFANQILEKEGRGASFQQEQENWEVGEPVCWAQNLASGGWVVLDPRVESAAVVCRALVGQENWSSLNPSVGQLEAAVLLEAALVSFQGVEAFSAGLQPRPQEPDLGEEQVEFACELVQSQSQSRVAPDKRHPAVVPEAERKGLSYASAESLPSASL